MDPSPGLDICILHPANSSLKISTFTYLFGLPDRGFERFEKLCQIKKLRLTQPSNSVYRLESVCQNIPESYTQLTACHGYHRECYLAFTKHLKRLHESTSTGDGDAGPATKRSRNSRANPIFSRRICLFCRGENRKHIRVGGQRTTEDLQPFTDRGDSVKLAAVDRDDKLGEEIQGADLSELGCHFHASCKRQYLHSRHRNDRNDERDRNIRMVEAHEAAFSVVRTIVEQRVIVQGELLTLNELLAYYITELSKGEFANPSYRSTKLKEKLIGCEALRKKIAFIAPNKNRLFRSEIIYSVTLTVSTAIRAAYEHSKQDVLAQSAQLLRDDITNAYNQQKDGKEWPISASSLRDKSPIPKALTTFLSSLLSRKTTNDDTPRLINSIGQDICRAVTDGKWKLPKHVSLAMALRHLCRSKKLNTLLYRLGHAEPYSFTLELETAIARSVSASESMFGNQVVLNSKTPSLVHFDWDNFNSYVSSVSGSSYVDTSHGIVLQELTADVETPRSLPSAKRTGDRTFKPPMDTPLAPCYISNSTRVGPKISCVKKTFIDADVAEKTACWKLLFYHLIRLHSSQVQGEELPNFLGFVSQTSERPERLTTIEYLPTINKPISKHDTVQEILKRTKRLADEAEQKYAFITFDLDVVMRAYQIMWKTPADYTNHIIMIGTFHLTMAYLNMIGKKMKNSGLVEILLDSGLMTNGTQKGILNGKNYYRSMECHRCLSEALERLLLASFMRDRLLNNIFEKLPTSSKSCIETFLKSRSRETLDQVFQDSGVKSLTTDYEEYRDYVRDGNKGLTASFWMQYLDHIHLVYLLQYAIRTNDFTVYGHCINKMCELFFAFNGHNYARYLTYFSVFLANIEDTHPGATELLKQGVISVTRSFIPGNNTDTDRTIEETFMKHAKSRSGAGSSGCGIYGIMENHGAYQRWVLTTHERAQHVQNAMLMADMTNGETVNHQLTTAEIRRGESRVKKLVDTIQSFMDPFETDDESKLFVLSSGAALPDQYAHNVLNADKEGAKLRQTFIDERLKKTDVDFFHKISRHKFSGFDATAKTVKLTIKNKIIELKQLNSIAFQIIYQIARSSTDIDAALREIMTYPLTPVPPQLGTPDGFLNKTNKAKLFHYLVEDKADTELSGKVANIVDGNALFHQLREIPPTYNGICMQLLTTATCRHEFTIFSTDSYNPNSIKSKEREIRGTGEQRIISGPNQRRPEKWSDFLLNDNNKKQLINMLLHVWKQDVARKSLDDKVVVLVCEEKAFRISSNLCDEVPEIASNQEETDSRVVLYCHYASKIGFDNAVVRTPDSDIFFILLHHAHDIDIKITLDIGSGANRRLIDVSEIARDFGRVKSSALLAIHAYSKCDSTSAFRGIGKLKPMRVVEKYPQYFEVFAKVGDEWSMTTKITQELIAFTAKLYSNTCSTDSVDELRFRMMKTKCTAKNGELNPKKVIDLTRLPPTESCLLQHLKRTNYQVRIWKLGNEQFPFVQPPTDDNGWVDVDGTIEPEWCCGEIVPMNLLDALNANDSASDSDSDSDDSPDDSSSSDSDSGSDEEMDI